MGIAVISDSFISQFAEIPLTVWSQPVEALAGKLADMISRRILEPPADAERKPEKYVFSSEIIVRESTRRNKFNGIYTIKTPETIND
jgi:DNA-binding LacI/PurR family transcriptional regulator